MDVGGWEVHVFGRLFLIVLRLFLWEGVVCKRPKAATIQHPPIREEGM